MVGCCKYSERLFNRSRHYTDEIFRRYFCETGKSKRWSWPYLGRVAEGNHVLQQPIPELWTSAAFGNQNELLIILLWLIALCAPA
jgi:hypothetical protein